MSLEVIVGRASLWFDDGARPRPLEERVRMRNKISQRLGRKQADG